MVSIVDIFGARAAVGAECYHDASLCRYHRFLSNVWKFPMQTYSDILILFSEPQDEPSIRKAKSHLMGVGRSVIVHQKEGQGRVLLVKFDPQEVTPTALLNAVTSAGFDAKMSGG